MCVLILSTSLFILVFRLIKLYKQCIILCFERMYKLWNGEIKLRNTTSLLHFKPFYSENIYKLKNNKKNVVKILKEMHAIRKC